MGRIGRKAKEFRGAAHFNCGGRALHQQLVQARQAMLVQVGKVLVRVIIRTLGLAVPPAGVSRTVPCPDMTPVYVVVPGGKLITESPGSAMSWSARIAAVISVRSGPPAASPVDDSPLQEEIITARANAGTSQRECEQRAAAVVRCAAPERPGGRRDVVCLG